MSDSGKRKGQFSIRINQQWRICFEWNGGAPKNVEIVRGKRAVTAETAMRLARYFGTSAGIWMRLQAQYDLEVAERKFGKEIDKRVAELTTDR